MGRDPTETVHLQEWWEDGGWGERKDSGRVNLYQQNMPKNGMRGKGPFGLVGKRPLGGGALGAPGEVAQGAHGGVQQEHHEEGSG